MVEISTVGIVSVPKRSTLGTSRRELSGDVPFGVGALLGWRTIELRKPPQRGVMYAVEYGKKLSDVGQMICMI